MVHFEMISDNDYGRWKCSEIKSSSFLSFQNNVLKSYKIWTVWFFPLNIIHKKDHSRLNVKKNIHQELSLHNYLQERNSENAEK